MEESLTYLLAVVGFTNDFRKVKRDIELRHELRPETSMEHSFQLAIVAWYLATTHSTDLDVNKVLRYALVHDLVETYAGDTPLYSANRLLAETKKKREAQSAARMQRVLPYFGDLHALIANYERLKDEESCFVYAVDKLLPLLSIYLDKGHAWKTHRITPHEIRMRNRHRVSKHPVAQRYFNEMLAVIEAEPDLFYERVQACCDA